MSSVSPSVESGKRTRFYRQAESAATRILEAFKSGNLPKALAPRATVTHIHIEDDGCQTTFDDRGNPTDAAILAETLRCTLPANLYSDLLTEMLQAELEYDRDMGHDERAEVWYCAYMLAAGNPESAFAPWETLREYAQREEHSEAADAGEGVCDAVA